MIERSPEVGELVRVRSRRWLVEKAEAAELPGESALVSLACAEEDSQGEELTVYWDYELDRQVLEEEGWSRLAAQGFDEPDEFGAFLHTLQWSCVTATDPTLFQSPFRAGIKIDAYQMEPLRKALRLPRVNLFIADDTGLGKTIEAGLIAQELLLRRKVKTIVVATPPSVLEQWKGELEERFGLIFHALDREYLAQMRRERGFGVNPWRTHSRFLVSHNLLKDETYAAPMREWLGTFCPGSLLILDEAHHAAPASGGRYGIESKFTRAVRDLARRFEHRLFLSATPHNGHSSSFSTLLEILDPTRFTRGVPVKGIPEPQAQRAMPFSKAPCRLLRVERIGPRPVPFALSCCWTASQVASSTIASCAPSHSSSPARILPTKSGFVSSPYSDDLSNARPRTRLPCLLVHDFVVQPRRWSSSTTESSEPSSRYSP